MNKKIISFPYADLHETFSAIGQENKEYVAAVTVVQNTMVTLRDLEMPPKSSFSRAPETYDDMKNCLDAIGLAANVFTSIIYSELLTFPTACTASLKRINQSLAAALKKVDFIIAHPEIDEDDLAYQTEMLVSYMDTIIAEAEKQAATLDILINNIQTFNSNQINTINDNINTILTDVSIDTVAYTQARDSLQHMQESLNKEINGQIANLVMTSIAIIGLIVTAVIGIAFGIATGGVLAIGASVVCGIIEVGIGLAAVGFDAYELISLNKDLNHVTTQLSEYESDILLLSSWGDTIKACSKQLEGITDNLETIQNSWVNVKSGFTTISSKITDSKGHLELEEWQKLKAVFEECQEVSEETMERINSLKIEDTRFADVKLSIGMTQAQVEEALQNATMLTFEERMLAI